MQIVIDIPEDMYQRIAVTPRCASGLDAFKDRDVFVKAIQKGEPLPKGHGRLIDDSNLMTVTDYDGENEKTYVPYSEIEDAPTIIEADKGGEE